MQRLLSRAVWDEAGVRDDLRALVYQTLSPPGSAGDEPPFPILVLDESGFPKRGRHSAGVGPQYCGATGQVENCQVGVFLSYVTALGHALIDRDLYVPEDWCADLPRRRAAHIPDTLTFARHSRIGPADGATRPGGRPALPLGGGRYRSQATALACATSWRSKATPTRWRCPPPKSSVYRPARASCWLMWPAVRSRRCVPATGSATRLAWAPKASASLIGPACPWCMGAP